MPGKLLQWLGAVLVLGLVAVGIGGVMVVKDRVRVVVQGDEPATGPEPIALLRDDLQVVATAQAELRSALGSNLERLGNALEERAEARHADVQALVREVGAARQSLAAHGAEFARLASRMQALEVEVAALRQAAAGASPAGNAAVPGEVAAVVAEPPAAPADAPPPAAVPAAEPTRVEPKPAAKGGFLSFAVPEAQFHFDAPQDYVLVPDLCRVGFDAKSTLHDFSGVTSKVAGRFTADFDDPKGAMRGEVACEAATLLTGVDGRDTNMWEHLDTKNHPQIRFVIAGFEPAVDGIDTGKQTARGTVFGQMTIRGQTRDLRLPVEVSVDASKRVCVKGQTPLKLSDYGVPVPSQLGVINMQDEVVVWVALRARLQAGVRK